MQSKILKDLSKRLFAGSAAQLALHALSMEPASENELVEIRALIAHKGATPLWDPPLGTKQLKASRNSRKDRL
jgi:hypothetical protein